MARVLQGQTQDVSLLAYRRFPRIFSVVLTNFAEERHA
jgi:hypothetical protein